MANPLAIDWVDAGICAIGVPEIVGESRVWRRTDRQDGMTLAQGSYNSRKQGYRAVQYKSPMGEGSIEVQRNSAMWIVDRARSLNSSLRLHAYLTEQCRGQEHLSLEWKDDEGFVHHCHVNTADLAHGCKRIIFSLFLDLIEAGEADLAATVVRQHLGRES